MERKFSLRQKAPIAILGQVFFSLLQQATSSSLPSFLCLFYPQDLTKVVHANTSK